MIHRVKSKLGELLEIEFGEHGTVALKVEVELEDTFEVVLNMTGTGGLEVIQQVGAVGGVRAVGDDTASAFQWGKPAEVGDALVGNYHMNGVFVMVHMAGHGDDGGDFAAFGNAGGHVNAEEGVAGEVARAADAVHHVGTGDVGGVGVAVEIDFEGGVGGDNTKATHNSGVVAQFLWAKNDLWSEFIEVVVEFLKSGG